MGPYREAEHARHSRINAIYMVPFYFSVTVAGIRIKD